MCVSNAPAITKVQFVLDRSIICIIVVHTHLVVLIGQHVEQEADQRLREFKFKCPEYEFLEECRMHQFVAQRWQITILIRWLGIRETVDGILVFLAIRFQKSPIARILAGCFHKIRIDIGIDQRPRHHLAHYFAHVVQIDQHIGECLA